MKNVCLWGGWLVGRYMYESKWFLAQKYVLWFKIMYFSAFFLFVICFFFWVTLLSSFYLNKRCTNVPTHTHTDDTKLYQGISTLFVNSAALTLVEKETKTKSWSLATIQCVTATQSQRILHRRMVKNIRFIHGYVSIEIK